MNKISTSMVRIFNSVVLMSLPIILVLLVVSNIMYTNRVCMDSCSLFLRVPSNNATDLIKTNHQSFGIYLIFAQLYKGKTIITPSDYWLENFIVNPELFTDWGELKAVIYSEYDPELSPEQFDNFMKRPNIKMDLYSYVTNNSVGFFIFPIRNAEETIAVFYRGSKVFVVPVDIVKEVIPGWKP